MFKRRAISIAVSFLLLSEMVLGSAPVYSLQLPTSTDLKQKSQTDQSTKSLEDIVKKAAEIKATEIPSPTKAPSVSISHLPELPLKLDSGEKDVQMVNSGNISETEVKKVARDKNEIIVKYKELSGIEETKKKFSKKKSNLQLKSRHLNKKMKLETIQISDENELSAAINELRNDPNVEYAQPNYKLEMFDNVQEPMFAEQWGLKNNGQTIGGQVGKAGIDINALAAWTLTKGSSSIKVGIVDTGVDIEHNDLKDSIYVNQNDPVNGIDDDGNGYIDDKSGWDFANQDNSVYDAESEDTHGTHVAGIIGAGLNNSGIAGISPEVKLFPAKFINGTTGFSSDAIEAIEYLEKMDVAIVNCSWGSAEYSPALYDVMKSSNMLFIAAAGNAGKNTDSYATYPACFDLPNIISVSAIDNKGNLASYSNYGSRIDIAAPGSNIMSTLPGNKYGMLSGTSMAAPAVSGAAVLLKSLDASIDAKGIKERLKNNVNKLSSLTGKISTSGSLNAYAALVNIAPENIETTEPDQNTEVNEEKSKEPEPVYDTSLQANNKVMKPLSANNNLFVDSLINKGATNTASNDNGIQNLKMSIIKGSYITVTWTTEKESSTELIYGQTEELLQSVVYKDMKTKHQITINPEDLSDFGYYKVRSVAEDGTVCESQTAISNITDLNEVTDQETSEVTQESVENNTQDNEQNNSQNEAQNISAFSYITDNGANHSKTNAQAISEGTVFGIMESQTYDDYYALNLESGKTYTIDLKGIAVGEDYDLKLINGSSFALGISANEENYDESITYTATYTGLHYIIAQSYTVLSTSAHHNYQLMFYSTQNKADTYEPNDSKDTATAIQNGVAISPTININADDDWFVIDTTKVGKLSVALNNVPTNCDFDLQVYKDGEYLGGSYLGSNKDEKFDKLITSAGKYYIRVYSCIGSDAVNKYKLKAGVYTPDGYEVNDDLYFVKNNNASVNINNWVTATIDNPDDIDGYKVAIGSDTKVGIRLQNIPSGMDYDVVLYSYSNYEFTEISRSTFGGNTDELISSQLVAGTYYVKVYSYWGSSETSGYKLSVTDENSGIVKMDFDKTNAAVGDIVTATVSVNNITSFAGYQVNVKYDPAVVQPVDDNLQPYSQDTVPIGATIIKNNNFSPISFASNDLSKGILNFGTAYINLAKYKQSGTSEKSGTLAVIKFKVLKSNQIQIKFENSEKMPENISGLCLYDWDGKTKTSGFIVQQPQMINSNLPINTQSVRISSVENNYFSLSPDVMYKFSGYISTDLVSSDPYIKADFNVVIRKINPDGTSNWMKSTKTNAAGFFEIRYKPQEVGNYTIEVTKRNYLKRFLSSTTISLGTDMSDVCFGTLNNPVMMFVGDVYDTMKLENQQDDTINMSDVIKIALYFNTSLNDNKYDANYDFNKDTSINMFEVMNIAKNFNKTTADYTVVTPALSKSIFFQEDYYIYFDPTRHDYFDLEVGKDVQAKMDNASDDDYFEFKAPEEGTYRLDYYSENDAFFSMLYFDRGSYYDVINCDDFGYEMRNLKKDQKVYVRITKDTGSNYTPDTYRLRISKLNPDLVIKSITPENITMGKAITFKAVVENVGAVETKAEQSFRVSLSIDGNQTILYTPAYSTSIPSYKQAELTFTMPSDSFSYREKGMHTITACVDDLNTVPEMDELNNYTSKYFYVEDYGNSEDDAKEIEVDKDVIGKIDYCSYINEEDVDYFKFFVPEDGTYEIYTKGTTVTNGLLSDVTTRIAYDYDNANGNNFYIKSSLQANKVYYIRVDSNDSMKTGEYILRVDPIRPDLEIEDVTPFNPLQGKPTVFSVKIKNSSYEGFAPGGFRVGIKIDNSDTVLWTNTYNSTLRQGCEDTLTVDASSNGTIIAFPDKGMHKLTVIVDDLNSVVEKNEENNVFTKTIFIDDYSDDKNLATPIVLKNGGLDKTEVLGAIDFRNDIDYLSITPSKTDTYRFIMSNYYVVFSLFDQLGNQVTSTKYYEMSLEAGKTYYIRIAHRYEYCTDDYNLMIKIVKPNLTIKDISPTFVRLNDKITLGAELKNTGDGSVPSEQRFRVKFTVVNDEDRTSTDYYSSYYSSYYLPLGPGCPVTLTMDSSITTLTFSKRGVYHVKATIDGTISESDYLDNSIEKDINAGHADLVITDIETYGNCAMNVPQKFDVIVKNVGLGSTIEGIPFKVKLTIDGQPETTYYTNDFSLPIKEDGLYSMTLYGPNDSNVVFKHAKSNTVRAYIEYTGDLGELNTDNNSSYYERIYVGSPPDLKVTDISYNPSDISEGDSVTFTTKIKNVGETEKIQGKVIRVGFKVDDSDVIIWSEYFTSKLEPNESVKITGTTSATNSQTANGKWIAVNGQHKITAIVDYLNEIDEDTDTNNTNGPNNTYSENINVASKCNLKVEDISCNPANPVAGEKVILSARIRNIGEGASPAGRTLRVGFKINNDPVSIWSQGFKWTIESNGYVTVSATAGTNGLEWIPAAEGSYVITAIVNDTSTICEDASNNSYTETVTVIKERKININEDYDGDGLSNLDEAYFGTDPYNYDTDGEGISDFDEIKKKNGYFTDPLNPDTDRDGIYDSTEYKISKNPLVKNESLPVVTTVSSMSQSVTVSVYGDSNLTVCPIKVFESDSIFLKSIKGVVGSPVEVSLNGYKMDHASITFSYSDSDFNDITEEDNLTIYWVDYKNKKFVPLSDDKVSIDKVNNKITGIVSHFSVYIAGQKSLLDIYSNKNVVFAIDETGSMEGVDPNLCRRGVVSRFISDMNSQTTKASIVTFDFSSACTRTSLTSDIALLKQTLANLQPCYGWTDISEALIESESNFDSSSSAEKYVILLSDGVPSFGSVDSIVDQVRIMAGKDIKIITVALGSKADVGLLTKIADATGGECFSINTDGNLTIDEQNAEINKVYTKICDILSWGEYGYNFPYIPDFDGREKPTLNITCGPYVVKQPVGISAECSDANSMVVKIDEPDTDPASATADYYDEENPSVSFNFNLKYQGYYIITAVADYQSDAPRQISKVIYAWGEETGNKPLPFTFSGEDIIFKNLNGNGDFTWKYISESEYNDFVESVDHQYQSTLNTDRLETIIVNNGKLFAKGNIDRLLSPEQLALLFLYDPWGVKIYLSVKQDNDYNRSVFKIITGKNPRYYSTIDGSWEDSPGNATTKFSEAEVNLTYCYYPPNLEDIFTGCFVAVTVGIAAGEVLLIGMGVAAFGWYNALTMYSYGVLGNLLPEIEGATEAELQEATTIVEAELNQLGTATTQTEVQAIERSIADEVAVIHAGTEVENALPNCSNAVFDIRKLTDYALNPEHPVGCNKARVFQSALGYTKDTAEALRTQIMQKLSQCQAIEGVADQYGQRYTVDILINGLNGNSAVVRTGWILAPGSTIPTLTTLFIK